MLVRTRPYRPAFADDRASARAFDQLTSSFFTNVQRTPVVDATWQDGSLVLAVDLPGTPADHVGVAVSGRTLTISVAGERSNWERSLRLGAALDAEAVSASYVDGRLTVTVAPAAQPEVRSIEISTSAPEAIEVAETPAETPAEVTEEPATQPENGTSESV
jgi:HSP20 family molecular chaperone IbpA